MRKCSFDLEASPPTVTIDATISKHRKEDVLPLHQDLVTLIADWTEYLAEDQLLFPKLEKRKAWLMVKKDLEAAGIPYKTTDGVADFHAAGRHTYITELLRNGVSVPEAMKLARHSDVRMTMKYVHIGMDDQSKALQNLPCQDISSKVDRTPSQNKALTDNQGHNKKSQNPSEKQGSGNENQRLSSSDSDCQERRTRGSNPCIEKRNTFGDKGLRDRPNGCAANTQCFDCLNRQSSSTLVSIQDKNLSMIVSQWSSLQPHIQEAIVTLCDAALIRTDRHQHNANSSAIVTTRPDAS